MALVKTSDLVKRRGRRPPAPVEPAEQPAAVKPAAPRRLKQRPTHHSRAVERIAAATEELARGMQEAAVAAEQLRRSLEQIAAGAEEAAGAAQESQAGVATLSASFAQARAAAETSRRKTETLQTVLLEIASQLETSVATVESAAARQVASVEVIGRLEKQATEVAATTRLVADISDRTNLLALNAAIEAARAGNEGKGFAIVADEVRALAETAERSAREIEQLSVGVATEVQQLAERVGQAADTARQQSRQAGDITADLGTIRSGLVSLSEIGQTILTGSIEADTAAREAGRGTEMVASAAEEQSAAVAEAQRAVQQQASALDQSQQASRALATLAEALQSKSAASGTAAEQVGTAAEELSATVQELSGAAGEILIAIDQITRGAQAQAAATHQANSAMAQIEKNAAQTRGVTEEGARLTDAISALLSKTAEAVEAIGTGFSRSHGGLQTSLDTLDALEEAARAIDRSVERIVLVAVQTSMLSVSGSVEAARAGEAGRGFAQVSLDIRKLAQDAAENIEGVRDVVRVMQQQIGKVRRDLEASLVGVTDERARNAAMLERMRATEQDVAAITRSNAATLEGSQLVLTATREVQQGTQQIAAAAAEASAAALEAASAAREQSTGAEDLAAAIEEIASLADELRLAAK